jgi:adenine-specific DNA-methyltransferase
MARTKRTKPTPEAASYTHSEAKVAMRPDVGTQREFRKKKPPVTYRYDSSLSPSLEWDSQNSAREIGEWLIAMAEEAARLEPPHELTPPRVFRSTNGDIVATVRSLADALDQLKRLGKPFLNWAGKAERLSFDVPTLPLFIHERFSTKAIIDTLVGHRKSKAEQLMLFGDPQHSVTDQLLRAYEHRDNWTNRMILGDSLVVMNSLLQYENLGGQVQMIYMDPPYGVKYGSNFQPFVRDRDVTHGDDADMSREPEMVQAYRDTWQVGLHSYLTCLRDRLVLARDLLHPTGSVFVQISDQNVHHTKELMDEVFGAENFCVIVNFRKTAGASSPQAKTNVVGVVADYLLWYARDKQRLKYRQLHTRREWDPESQYKLIEINGERRRMTADELRGIVPLPAGARVFRLDQLASPGIIPSCIYPLDINGKAYYPPYFPHISQAISTNIR